MCACSAVFSTIDEEISEMPVPKSLAALLLLSFFAGSGMAQTPAPSSTPAPPPAVDASRNAPWMAPAEDWSTPSINSLHLQPYPAMVTEHDVMPTYTRDLVRVQWRPGDSIELFVFVPRGATKAPAILYLYSYPSDVDRFVDKGWATRATSDGFAAVGFVSALTGQRYHTRPMKEWFVSELQESLGESVHDVQMILNYLATRGDIDMSNIGMFGQGSGGAIAILAAQADRRIQALDLMNPWGDWPEWLKESAQVPDAERPDYLKPEFLQKVANLDPVTCLPQLKVRSLRIQQVMSDSVTPKTAMDRIAAAAPSPADVFRFPDGAAHFEAMHVAGVSGWLKMRMESAPAPSQTSQPQRVAGITSSRAENQ
jgi:hypothetical protein